MENIKIKNRHAFYPEYIYLVYSITGCDALNFGIWVLTSQRSPLPQAGLSQWILY